MAGFLNLTGTNGTASTVTSLATTVAIAATKGNTIIGIAKISAGLAPTSVTDTQSNTWTVDASSPASGPRASVIRSKLTKSLSTSDSVTVNFSSTNNITVVLCEYEGTYDPLDVTASGNTGTVSASTVTASGNIAQAPELVVAGLGTGSASSQNVGGISITSGTPSTMTLRGQGPSTKNFGALADAMASSVVTPSASWAWTVGPTTWGGIIATYKLVKTTNTKFFFAAK